ncbi:MAG: MaoC family dehydratase N-terminal domain-containing protein [Actinomycetota bacterium]
MTLTEEEIQSWVGREEIDPPGDIACERGYIRHWLEATENANPLYWDESVANKLTSGAIAPPTMLSVWMRPLQFVPGRDKPRMPLSLHFALKEALGLPEGIVKVNEIEFRTPVRPGDVITTTQRVREIGEMKTSRLGTGRDWTIDVTSRNQRGDVLGIETNVMFGYRRDQ